MIKDINSPSRWNTRIWDVDNECWLGEHDKDGDLIPYYGFDIRGGEVTFFQGLDWLYKEIAHGRRLIWEMSTGHKDRNGKEICEGDIVLDVLDGDDGYVVEWDRGMASLALVSLNHTSLTTFDAIDSQNEIEVIGNIHENPELIKEEDNETEK